jgi:hypothetical protein
MSFVLALRLCPMQHAGARSTLVNQRHSGASNKKEAFIKFALRLIRSLAQSTVERKQVGAKVQRRIASLESFKRLLPDLLLDGTISPSQDLLCQDRELATAFPPV